MAEINDNKNEIKHRDGKVITGTFFLVIGALLLANKMGAGIPNWLFTWPSILIIVGLYIGVKHRFQNFGALIMIAIGSLYLINNEFIDLNLQEYGLPIIFLAVGLLFLTRPKNRFRGDDYWKHKDEWKKKWDDKMQQKYGTYGMETNTPDADAINKTTGEFIEVNSVFGSAKKFILSKNFRGGEINCFMGGAEIDLTQADIQGPVIIEANQVFGGTKLVIPAHWDLKIESTSIFGGLEDKRRPVATQIDTNKALIIKGVTIFGGMEIKSY
ncbi:hypothetical protein I5907_18735 [Panacibacter sp. DH6]|uniref:LiaF transmembrane domain-containing protein n=1 Tax=Panacibacter microcysteis TaxID=2793269 RepID=A0A931GZK7_9BACT|nr:DUF5668 domain-containing protein [Panacibacter microcysteis]MBG9378281.1 hypothetical protein [Panacibacter microcysteis]